jgi:phosphoglycerol transferase
MGYYGFDNFYSTHRFDTVIDRDTIVASRGSLSPRTADPEGWGIFDGEMFSYMLDYIAEKEAADRPFSVVMATMDTHGPQGLISPQCTEHGVGEYSDDMRDALRCTSQMVDQFLRDLAVRVDMNNTKVVVMSDHLAHRNNLTPMFETGSRRNLVMLLDGPNSLRVDAPSSMIDVYPTILDWLGLLAPGKPKAGMGVSLLSRYPTLIEAYGLEEINTRLRVDVELARFIWE